jgi:hypothetical protein
MLPRDDEHLVCVCGIDACNDILKAVGFEKALDPLDARDFLVLVERLAQALTRKTASSEASAIKAAMQAVDVDWANLSAAARARTISAARVALDAAKRGALPSVKQEFELRAPRIVGDTRAATRTRFNLNIEASLSEFDQSIADHLRKSQTAFVTDAYGRRSEAFSAMAREKVAQGLEQGLGRADIAADLQRMTGAAALNRGPDYWRVVSAAFMNRGRVGSLVSAFDEAKIESYRFRAVLDQKTTLVCRYMDGQTFSVRGAVDTIKRTMAAENPEEIRNLQPWVESGKDAEGNAIIYYKNPDGSRQVVADVLRSGVGRNDDRGEFRSRMDTKGLETSGISMPPLHRTCRSTIVTLT